MNSISMSPRESRSQRRQLRPIERRHGGGHVVADGAFLRIGVRGADDQPLDGPGARAREEGADEVGLPRRFEKADPARRVGDRVERQEIMVGVGDEADAHGLPGDRASLQTVGAQRRGEGVRAEPVEKHRVEPA
ncbi:MAG: hypothetical protein M9895_05820 [Aquamicrobium sp.]|uniref:hypothetical protein n=1 Tax=Aquamicrobium sp. TaxID=1872579 RepID=UPI00349E7063|nr:hypothetical protein [Aquamicrobium sp.]